MNELRIILDKSVVFGLSNAEVDSLDRYYFQIIPDILTSEILADLTKGAENPRVRGKIKAHSYRVSGNRGLTMNYRHRLANSLLGNEIPMDGRFFPSGESTLRTQKGALTTLIETPLEDETIARWERGDFTEQEKTWAESFRRQRERPLNQKLYTDSIAKAGLTFSPPLSDEELIDAVGSLLAERKLLPRLFVILSREFGVPLTSQEKVLKRWNSEGRPSFNEFAPYAFFCLQANFLWNLGLTNPRLFQADKNDRKDLEYCYSLPNTEIFSSRDDKHKRLVPALLRADQSFVDGSQLKQDLNWMASEWEKLTREERIHIKSERGNAPIENENSLSFQLWKKHRGKITTSLPLGILDMPLVDTSLPQEQQVTMTFGDLIRKAAKEMKTAEKVSETEMSALRILHKGKNPTTMGEFKRKMSRERILKLHPELTEVDLDKANSED